MNANLIATGNKVSGEYFGQQFSGVIFEARPHTMRNDLYIVTVALDQPITLFAKTRAHTCMEMTSDGKMPDDLGFIVAA